METSSFMDRLRKGENLHTEFKLWPLRPDDLAAAMVAFANTDGGEIFLGVADDGAIRGIAGTDTDSVTQFVDNIAFQNCAPPMGVTQQIIRDVGVDSVIGVSVAKGDERPYRTNRGVYYVRTISGPIRLLVFDDRVEVRSPGRLPNSVRVEQLSAGVHVLRNPTLYNMLLRRGLVTDTDSGIPRVIRLLRDKTGREPNFRSDGSEFVVTLKRPDSPMASGD